MTDQVKDLSLKNYIPLLDRCHSLYDRNTLSSDLKAPEQEKNLGHGYVYVSYIVTSDNDNSQFLYSLGIESQGTFAPN